MGLTSASSTGEAIFKQAAIKAGDRRIRKPVQGPKRIGGMMDMMGLSGFGGARVIDPRALCDYVGQCVATTLGVL